MIEVILNPAYKTRLMLYKLKSTFKLVGTTSYVNAINNINRHENDTANNFDQFIQGKLALTDALDLHAGMRHTKVAINFEGLADTPTKISGATSFSKTTPVIGLIWKATQAKWVQAKFFLLELCNPSGR